jgi:hypothetical protein
MAVEDWKNKLQGARDSGQQVVDHQTDAIMNKHWPQIQSLFREKVGPAALVAAHDDHKMESLFKVVYKALLFPVHFVVKEPAFIQFCFAHRDQLLPPGEARAKAAS